MQTKLFSNAILAGVFISIGGIAFLTVGGILGAILFTFGLIGVLHYKLPLFTGTAGFIETKQDCVNLIKILIGNIVGCGIMAALCQVLTISSITIVSARLLLSPIQLLILSMFCGFIMTTAVKFGRENKYLPTLFGVPLFISCGFIHSIADAFYYLLNPISWNLLWIYPLIVIGNFIGCNVYRLLNYEIRRNI